MSFLLDRAFAALQSANHPAAVGAMLFMFGWGIGGIGVQRGISARLARAKRYYTDAERGRFIDRLRSALTPGGALRHVVDQHIDRALLEMERSARDVVTRELEHACTRLEERCREMRWLRDQLRDFLRVNGITREDLTPDDGKLVRNTTGIRYTVERGDDLLSMMKTNPPTEDRFRSKQAELMPLRAWSERYSDEFLSPLDFLERLSGGYRDPFEQELARAGTGPQQRRLIDELGLFLKRSFQLALDFHAQDGVQPDRHFALIPSGWRELPGVRPALSALRINEQSTIATDDTGRLYLLWLQTGVDPKCLLGAQ
jgi:hypothetical protein